MIIINCVWPLFFTKVFFLWNVMIDAAVDHQYMDMSWTLAIRVAECGCSVNRRAGAQQFKKCKSSCHINMLLSVEIFLEFLAEYEVCGENGNVTTYPIRQKPCWVSHDAHGTGKSLREGAVCKTRPWSEYTISSSAILVYSEPKRTPSPQNNGKWRGGMPQNQFSP